ncbi:TetR/AcrR family transcriptional regulator [Mycolicibacter acidiphilus]|uniref:TetR/AcrR family transcriptional regulator n=1 Tax=Mycolicibacter acidiphilus TaxID=2835306 RepID=UPI0027DBA15F|nr:helix-turn-helix domain-containing protein [Mycolicibacter acidiphilus]
MAALTAPGPTVEGSADTDVIIDAALAVFGELGLRRATIDDVAKRAGVGRVTVYRRVGSKQDLIDAALGREAQRLFTAVMAATDAADDMCERIAVSFAATVTAVRNNAVWQRLLTLETDSALQQLTVNGQSVLVAAVGVTLQILYPDLGDALPSAEQLARAELLVRVTHSVLLTPHAVVPLADYPELTAFARAHLVPIAVADSAARPGN